MIYSGNIVLPIDSSYREDEILYIVKKAKPDLILCETKFRRNYVSTDIKLYDSTSFVNLQEAVDYKPIYNQIALLMTTTGSTGTPKLVMLTHENIIENTNSILNYLNISKLLKRQCKSPTLY